MGKRIAHYHPVCPDGGWGWMVVFGSFMLHVIMDGIIYTFGLFFYAMSNHFQSTKAATSMVVSIMNSVTYCSGPIASALTVKYGCRAVTIAGALLAGAGFAVSVLADSIYQLYFPIGILSGFGFGLMYLPAIVIVTTWFEKKRSFATGLAVAGSGIGTMVFSPTIELIINHLSWQTGMLIVAGLLSVCAFFGGLFKPVPQPAVSAANTTHMTSSGSSGNLGNVTLESQLSPGKDFDVESRCASIAHSDSHSLRSPHPMDKIDEEDEESQLGFNGNNDQSIGQFGDLVNEGLAKEGLTNGQGTPFMKCAETTSLACLEQLLSVPGTVVSLSSKGPKSGAMCAKSLCSVEFNGSEDSHFEFEHSVRSRPHSVCPGILDRKDIFYTGSIANLATDEDFYEVDDDDDDDEEEGEYDAYSGVSSLDEHGRRNRNVRAPSGRSKILRWFSCPDDMLKEMSKMMDFKLLKNNVFLMFAISNFLTSIGYHIPFIFLKDRMLELGVAPAAEAGNFNAVIGLASTISRLVFGYIADHQLIRRLTLYNISITLCGLAVMLTPFATTPALFYTFCALFGTTAGIYVSLTSVVLTDLLGLERLTNAFGLILLFQGVGSLIGPPLIGMLYDLYGNYDYGFLLAGGIIAISGIMLFFIDLDSYFKSLKRLLRFK